jgi:hypothetical protein
MSNNGGNIEERFFARGQRLRPKPILRYVAELDCYIILTPWGEQATGEFIADKIAETLLGSYDSDSTRIGEVEKSEIEQALESAKKALNISNSLIFSENNKTAWSFCAECLILRRIRNHLLWARVGQPSLFIFQEEFVPVSLAFDFLSKESSAPIFSEALGLSNEVSCSVGYLIEDQPQLSCLVIKQSQFRGGMAKLVDPNLDSLSKQLGGSSHCFWLGLISF